MWFELGSKLVIVSARRMDTMVARAWCIRVREHYTLIRLGRFQILVFFVG